MTKNNDKPKLTIVDKEASEQEVEEVTPERELIYEVKTYADDNGKTVIGRYPLDDPDLPVFMGVFAVQSSMGPIQLQMRFSQGLTVQECFNHFDELAQETVEQAQQEANEQNRIVTPGQSSNEGIIVP